MNLQMVTPMKDTLWMVREKVRVFIHGLIKVIIKEIGLKIE